MSDRVFSEGEKVKAFKEANDVIADVRAAERMIDSCDNDKHTLSEIEERLDEAEDHLEQLQRMVRRKKEDS